MDPKDIPTPTEVEDKVKDWISYLLTRGTSLIWAPVFFWLLKRSWSSLDGFGQHVYFSWLVVLAALTVLGIVMAGKDLFRLGAQRREKLQRMQESFQKANAAWYSLLDFFHNEKTWSTRTPATQPEQISKVETAMQSLRGELGLSINVVSVAPTLQAQAIPRNPTPPTKT